jgi:prepilin-type N-terminal cleavage/methylation domain-containing protein
MFARYGTDSRAALRRGGFTLVELLVVVAIVIMLVAIAMPIINMADKAGRNSQSKAVQQSLRTAVEAFRGEFGIYPDAGNWITLITQPVRKDRTTLAPSTAELFGRPYGPFMASSANNFDGSNFIDGFLRSVTLTTTPPTPIEPVYRYEVIGSGITTVTRTTEARILWAGPNGVFETLPTDTPSTATQFSPIPAGSDDIAG